MKLGDKFLICVSLIEVKTAKVLSNVNQSIKGLDEAPNGLITLTQDILKTIALTEMEMGKTGPGGGIIFYIDGDKAFECSKMLEEQEWENAKEVCKQYRGGGYADQYLPTKEELNWIYENLIKDKIEIENSSWHWSSSSFSAYTAWIQNFSDGRQTNEGKIMENSFYAVRSFKIANF